MRKRLLLRGFSAASACACSLAGAVSACWLAAVCAGPASFTWEAREAGSGSVRRLTAMCRDAEPGAFLGVRIFRNAGGNFPGFVRNGFRVAHRNGHVGVGNVRSRCGFLLCLLAARQCAGAGDGQFQVGIRQSSAADGGIVTLAGLRCASQPGIGPCEVEMGFGGFRMDLQRFFKMVNRLFRNSRALLSRLPR